VSSGRERFLRGPQPHSCSLADDTSCTVALVKPASWQLQRELEVPRGVETRVG
jgi:hypothetical protein